MLPNANSFTVNTLYNKYYYYHSSYFSKCVNASNVSFFPGSHKEFDVQETMPVCNTKTNLLPCEQRFLSYAAFSVYEVVGVAWQSCSCFFFFFLRPESASQCGTLRKRQTTK